tara:strand:+ start:3313 stop:4392 length:1080 start_codon:yes stop_codon:yes gene_type:complete
MNTLILVTQNNLEEITAFAKELGERQKLSNSGKLLITGGYYLDDNQLREIGRPLGGCYEVTELTKVQVSPDQDGDTQLATMLATFIMQRYTTVPGPWLVVDSRFEINRDNPISLMEKLHNESQQENSGRATTTGGGRVPVGPVVIGAEAQRLSTLRTVSGEPWRGRGRWVFNVCSWNQISAEDYPFRVPAIEASDEAKSGSQDKGISPGVTKVVEVTENASTSDLPISNYVPQKQEPTKQYDGFMEVEPGDDDTPMTTEKMVEKMALGDDEVLTVDDSLTIKESDGEVSRTPVEPKKEIDNSHIPKPFVPIEPDTYETASKEVLIEQVHKRSGKKPHPRTGIPKLIASLRELDLSKIQE